MSSCERFTKIAGNCNKVERCAETGLCIFIVLYDMGRVWSVCAPFRVPKVQLQLAGQSIPAWFTLVCCMGFLTFLNRPKIDPKIFFFFFSNSYKTLGKKLQLLLQYSPSPPRLSSKDSAFY